MLAVKVRYNLVTGVSPVSISNAVLMSWAAEISESKDGPAPKEGRCFQKEQGMEMKRENVKEKSVAGISEVFVTQCNCWERSTPMAGLCWWICGFRGN